MASNLKSPQTWADNVVSDSSLMSPVPTVGQSLLRTVTENETDHLSSGALGVGHKSFHSAMRATSFHFPENCSLAKKYWWFSLEQFISQRQLKTICTNDAKYHTFECLWGWEAKKLRQQESFEHGKVSTYLIWEQNAYALCSSCISLQYLFLLWKQFNSPKAALQVFLYAELALQKRSERAENRREKGSKVCSCNQPRRFCLQSHGTKSSPVTAALPLPAWATGQAVLCAPGWHRACPAVSLTGSGESRALRCIWNICVCLCCSHTFFLPCRFFFTVCGWNTLYKAQCKCVQRACISHWNLHKQVICISYVILENMQEKLQEEWRK